MTRNSLFANSVSLLLLAGAVEAQTIPVTLDVQPRTFTTPRTLSVTWSAPSPATTCTASGGWSGTKATSGTEQVPGQVGNVTYNLTCTGGGGSTTVNLSWTNPTKNTDGTNYTNAKHVEVYRATSAASLPTATGVVVPPNQQGVQATSYQFTGVPTGMNYFATKAVSLTGQKSDMSMQATKDVQGAGSSGTAPPVTVTGTQQPQPPTGVVATTTQAYAVKPSETKLAYILDGVVGTVEVGDPCDPARPMGVSGYYAINRAQYVTWTTGRRPTTVVTACEAPE